MKIAVFDYQVVASNPAGSCHQAMIAALASEHEFTVFANQFDNPAPDQVRWVHVPAIRRPLAALFVTFHVTALFRYLQARWQRRGFALVQSIESNFGAGDLVYSHFCHCWFLRHKWKSCGAAGFRGLLRWMDHFFHAALEPWAMHRAKWIIVPSRGLARELRETYPFTESKLRVIPNPVDLDSYRKPATYDPSALRMELGIRPGELMIVFVALGHFERKGLPVLLEALAGRRESSLRLVVVGGSSATLRSYRNRVRTLRLQQHVSFVGHQADVRKYLWSADLFALPSLYETFGLAVVQAAAASCPVLVTRLNGVEDFLDASTALMVEPDVPSVGAGLDRFLRLSAQDLEQMTERARAAVSNYGVDRFSAEWRALYRLLESNHPTAGGLRVA
jgi:glycosyltransferase involved in cell wall biosynthesis